jgi:VWFA-related protein
MRPTAGLALLAFLLTWWQEPPTLRSAPTLVTVDVRVVDAKGNPITDLKKDDVSVGEDSIDQDIRAFEARPLDNDADEHHRTFLFVLARGRAQDRAGAAAMLKMFAGDHLQPADRVGVLATDTVRMLATRDQIVAALDEAVATDERVDTDARQDVVNLYTGVSFLRQMPGDKQLIFIGRSMPLLPQVDRDHGIGALAGDARVTIDFVPLPAAAAPDWPRSFGEIYSGGGHDGDASLTGGMAADVPSLARLDAIDRASRFEYLIGYSPSNSEPDSAFRRIAVKVNRSGARVLFRHGYFAAPGDLPLGDPPFSTSRCVAETVNALVPARELPLNASVDYQPGGRDAVVSVTMPAESSSGSIYLAIFAGGAGRLLAGTGEIVTGSPDINETRHVTLSSGDLTDLNVIACDTQSPRATGIILHPTNREP